MKIIVYAICKNEAQFVERFMRSCAGADGVYVLDTGSTDGTPERLRALGATVYEQTITPWRFDIARNASLEMLPEDADVCICLDLDEVLCPGWREALEAAWTPGTTRARYTYVWSHTPGGGDGVVFYADKIHARHGYRWTHPVHEVLTADAPESCITIPELRVEHWPDEHKSRGQYLPLLELSVAEDPDDDRNMHYLGREYMFHGRWGEAIATLMRHLAMPSARWAAERAASMRYIARCCDALGDWQSAVHWLERAADEAPGQREAPYALSLLYYRREDWALCRYWAMRALHITARDNNYMTEPEAWGSEPHDLMAISSWQLGQWEDAVAAAEKAVELEPGNERLQNNLKIMRCSHDSKSK